MTALAAIAGAAAILATPVGLLEMLVASSGLSEAVPAAAPPLGLTARLVMAGFAALLMAGIVNVMRPDPAPAGDGRQEQGRDDDAQGATKMGFAFSKLTALARGRAVPAVEIEAPVLRRADAHPDAPPRPPIFASRDFDGLDIFGRADPARRTIGSGPAPAVAEPASPPRFAMPGRIEDAPQPAFDKPLAAATPPAPVEAEPEDAPVPSPAAALPAVEASLAPLPLPTHGLSVGQLTERLERGLAARRRLPGRRAPVLADLPVAPRVPVREAVAADTDEALRAALGTLRDMAGRKR